MITIGVDFHKRTSTYHVLNAKGEKLLKKKMENHPDQIIQFLSGLPQEPKQIACEATRNWNLFFETVEPYVEQFYLGHPKKMKAITESETKNDLKDAELIAMLTYTGFLPKAHIPSMDTRQLRSLIRFRSFLINQRRSIRNQVQILVDRNVWVTQRPKSFKNLFCKRGLKWLEQLKLPERERIILNHCLNTFEELSSKIFNLEAYMNTQSPTLPGLEFLRTVPGFKRSQVNAYVVLTEASDITRFKKARSFAHYAGLVPREFSSGDHHRTGKLIKGANMHLRTALIESTLAAIRNDPGLKIYYKQVKARRGSGSAIVATARKLAYAVYYVLKEQRAYRQETIKQPPAAVCHP